jgi:Leu/Phe-tRNA-protein transferase
LVGCVVPTVGGVIDECGEEAEHWQSDWSSSSFRSKYAFLHLTLS